MTTESHDGTRTGKRAGKLQTWWRLAALALTCAIWPLAASAEPRLALVIGNSEYGSEMGRLPNPANDAGAIAGSLRALGFDVVQGADLDRAGMERTLAEFFDRARAAPQPGMVRP